jgi:hypothetical protein
MKKIILTILILFLINPVSAQVDTVKDAPWGWKKTQTHVAERETAHDTLAQDVNTSAADIAALEDTTDEHRNILDSLVNENYQYAMVHQQSYLPWNDAMWGIPGSGGDSTMENLRLAFSKTGRGDWIDVGVVFDPVWNLRDPSMIQVGDTFFVACSRNVFAGTGYGYFTIIKSADLFNWTEVANISVAWAHPDGASGINAVWAPKWFYDETKDSTYIIVSINEAVNNSFQLYALKALNNNMNSFETGRRITITDKPSVIDGSIIIKDGQYYIVYKNEGCVGNKCYEMAVGNSMLGAYTTYHEGNWKPEWGYDIEGFEIRKFGSVYRLYMDKYYNRDPFKEAVGLSYAESYDMINWSNLYDMNIQAAIGSVVKLRDSKYVSFKPKKKPLWLEVGGDPYNYALKMEGIREALKDLDSGVVYVNYPGVNDTTGLGAIPAKKYVRGWISGKYTNGNVTTSFGGDVRIDVGNFVVDNYIDAPRLDSLETYYAPQWSGTSTGLNAATARTSLSLNNVENTALSTWAGSTNITTLGTVTSAGAFTSSGNITAGSASSFVVGDVTMNTGGITQTGSLSIYDVNPKGAFRLFRTTTDTTAEFRIHLPNTTSTSFIVRATTGTITALGGINAGGSITTSARFLAPNGTNAIPAYSFTNKTNSGWNMTSAGSMQYISNNVPKITIDSAGQVGIGARATSPSALLQLGKGVSGGASVLYRGLILNGDWSSSVIPHQNLITFQGTDTANPNPFDDLTGEAAKNWHMGIITASNFFNSPSFVFINRGVAKLTLSYAGNLLIGTTDDDGTPAPGRVTIKAANNNGTSNIIIGRNSSEENKFRVSDRGTIHFDGGFYSKPVNETNGYTPAANDHIILLDETAGGGDVFMNAGIEGQQITIKKKDASANAVTLYPDGSETIDGAGSYALATQYKYVTMVFSSGHWWIIGNN